MRKSKTKKGGCGKRFTEAQKVRAVKLFVVKGKSAREAAEAVKTTEVSVRNWAQNRRLRKLAKAA